MKYFLTLYSKVVFKEARRRMGAVLFRLVHGSLLRQLARRQRRQGAEAQVLRQGQAGAALPGTAPLSGIARHNRTILSFSIAQKAKVILYLTQLVTDCNIE